VKDGPDGRQVPSTSGSHDLCTGRQAKMRDSVDPRWPKKMATMDTHTMRRYTTSLVPLKRRR